MPLNTINNTFDIIKETQQAFDVVGSKYYIFDDNWQNDCEFILNALANNILKPLQILELGCAAGRIIVDLYSRLNKGSTIYGLDKSDNMINQAKDFIRRQGLEGVVRLIKSDICNSAKIFEDITHDLILCLNNTFGNLVVNDMSKMKDFRYNVLRKIRHALKDRGILVLSVYNLEKFSGSDDYSERLCVSSEHSNLSTGDIIIFHTYPDGKKRYCYSHWFKKKELLALLGSAGFRIIKCEVEGKRIVISAMKK